MRIGSYEVLGELGRGGMGIVYRVRAPDGREAALKVLARADPGALARFERERRLLASLGEAEGFVGLLDAGSSPEGAWLVMPLVSGGTLRARLEAGPFSVDATIALGIELGRALGEAHARGIVHRDVKPENVLFTANGRALVSDLGLAKHFDPLAEGASRTVQLTRPGAVTGSAGYVSPEQIDDARTVGPASDVFSLGAVLHECLTGRPAFEGDSVLEVLAKVSSASFEPIERRDVPHWLVNVLARALACEPAERFTDGAKLAQALEQRDPRPGRRSRSFRLILGATALVAILGGAALALFPRRSPSLGAREQVKLSKKLYLAHDFAGAAAELERALELDPRCIDAWANRGVLRIETGDLDGAIADETKAIELDPRFGGAWANRACARTGKRDWAAVIADATEAIELDPRIALAWQSRGVARGEMGDRDGEIADETRAIELDPKVVVPWLQRGVARGVRGDLEGEIADETKAIELDPRSGAAWSNRSVARRMKHDLEGALADAEKAIALAPSRADVWSNRALIRGERGDPAGGIADATRAIELDPKSAIAWAARGEALGARGRWDEAIADQTRSIELDPSAPLVWAARGQLRSRKGDLAGALADDTKAIELAPTAALAWANRCVHRGQGGDWDGATSDATKAIELDPTAALAWANRGYARKKTGDLEGAIADLERALELHPGNEADVRRWLEDARTRAR